MFFHQGKAPLHLYHLDDSPLDLKKLSTAVRESLFSDQFVVQSFSRSDKFLLQFSLNPKPDLVILDFDLADELYTGISIAAHCRRMDPNVVIILCTHFEKADLVNSARSAGADDYLSKGYDPDMIARRLLKIYDLACMRRGLSEGPLLAPVRGRARVVGRTLREIEKKIPLFLDSAVSSIYLEGESGTGKEVVADIIESFLPRTTPFVRFNCAAIAPSLLESELFGYTKGSFTGANSDKMGILESANGGWLFLDEISTLTLQAQASLLRAIESRQVRRVGDTQTKSIRIKILSASNEPLSLLVGEKKFRMDLFQRIKEIVILIPPLRNRPDETPELIHHFCETVKGGPYVMSAPALHVLSRYTWNEGNARELRNAIVAMTAYHLDKTLTPGWIPEYIWNVFSAQELAQPQLENGQIFSQNFISIPWSDNHTREFQEYSDLLLFEIIERLTKVAKKKFKKTKLKDTLKNFRYLPQHSRG